MKRSKPARKPKSRVDVYSEFNVAIRCTELFNRFRQTCVFPVNRDLFIESLYTSLHGTSSNDPKVVNTILTVNKGALLHVCLNEEEWNNALRGIGSTERVFWLKFPKDVPVPVNAAQGVLLPQRNPYYAQVLQWYIQAEELHLQAIHEAEFIKASINIAGVYIDKFWSGLVEVLGVAQPFKGSSLQVGSVKYKNIYDRMHRWGVLDKDRQGEIVERLAAATLLPDTSPCVAWPGWHAR